MGDVLDFLQGQEGPEKQPQTAGGQWLFADPQEVRSRWLLEQATRRDPAKHAEAVNLANRWRLPAETVERNLDEVRRQDRLARLEEAANAAEAPHTAALSQEPDWTAAASDDIEHLGTFERFWRDLSAKWRAGQAFMQAGELAFRRERGEELTLEERLQLERLHGVLAQPEPPENLLTWIPYEGSKVLGQMVSALPQAVRRGLQGAIAGAGAGALAGGLGAGPGAALGFGAGFGAGFAEQFARSSSGQFAEQLIDQGVDSDTARVAGSLVGLGEGALEYVGVSALGRPWVQAAKGAFRRAAVEELTKRGVGRALGRALLEQQKAALEETSTEVLQELNQIAVEWVVAQKENRPDLAPQEIGSRLWQIMTMAYGASLGLTGLPTVSQFATDARHARVSRFEQAAITAAGEAAESSKLRERLPEAFRRWADLLAAEGPVQNLYIDPVEAGQALFQSGIGYEELQQVAPSLAKQWAEADALGADIVIPLGEYQEKIAGTPLGERLRPHLRGSPEGFSLRSLETSAARFEEAVDAEYKRALAEQEGLRPVEAADQIAQEISRELARSGLYRRPEDIADQAQLWGKLFTVLGSRAGVDPVEYFRRWNVRVRRQLPELARNAVVDRLDLALDRATAYMENRELLPRDLGPSLLPFLKNLGGVRDTGGELAAMDAQRHPGLRRAKTATAGLDPDEAALQAWEAGYFPELHERPTPDDLFEAIRDELAGAKRYVQGDQERLGLQRAETEELLNVVDALGLDLRTAPREEVKSALEGMLAEEEPPEALRQSTFYQEPLPAIRLKNGKTIIGHNYETHLQLLEQSGADADQVAASGWMVGNELHETTTDATKAAEREAAKKRTEARRETRKRGETLFQPASQVDSKAFQEWFGNSKVVDENGDPLIVYHGTKADEIVSFDLDKLGASNQDEASKIGFFFTPDAEEASVYGPNVGEYFLSIQKPKTVTTEDANEFTEEWLRELEDSDPEQFELESLTKRAYSYRGPGSMRGLSIALQKAKSEGYDGVIYHGTDDAIPYTNYIVFRPQQIKSVFNRGTFDPNDPRILYQPAEGGAPPRGSVTFLPDQTLIRLFENADLSTFLHESAHVFLRAFAELAGAPNAPAELQADLNTLRAWLGMAEGQQAVTREQEEKFARAFEAYLFEGKAPSNEIAGIFRRMRAWLLAIYRRAVNLKVDLNDDIRGIFDRMLATDEEIANRERAYSSMAGLEELMTEAERKAYADLAQKAHDAAISELERQALKEVTAAAREQLKARRKALTADVEALIRNRPVYRATQWLSKGEWTGDAPMPEGLTHARLDTGALEQMFGREVLHRLRIAVPPIYGPNGIHPDLIAPVFGYASGEALVLDLLNATPRKTAVNQEVSAALRAEIPDWLADTSRRADEALDAVHGDERARWLLAELNVLSRRTRTPTRSDPSVLDVAKLSAQRILASKPAAEATKVGHFERAEARAARAAQKALAAGDFDEAAEQKRKQILNHYLVKEALAARDELKKIERHFRRYRKREIRAKLDPEALRQVLRIFQRIVFPVGLVPEQFEGETAGLAQWLESMQEEGVDVYVGEWVANEANRAHYEENLPLRDLRGVYDTVRSIEKTAKRKRKLYTTGENFDAAATRLAAYVQRAPTPRRQSRNLTPSGGEEIADRFGQRLAELTRMEFLFRRLDRGVIAGPIHEMLFQPFVEAENEKTRMRAETVRQLREIYRRHYTRSEMRAWRRRQWVPELGKMVSKADALAMALNWGNEQNRTALMRGLAGGARLKESELEDMIDVVEGVLGTLETKDWAWAQEVWDLIDSFWPQVRQQQIDIVGVAPKKVQALPVIIGAQIVARGGYYPLKYDERHSERAARYREKGDVSKLFENNYTRAMTAHGHTIERVGSGGLPVKLDLGVLMGHLDQVITDLTHRKAVIDVDRLINDSGVKHSIINAVGRQMYRQLRPWLHALANAPGEHLLGWEKWMLHARRGMTVATLGVSLTTAMRQFWSWFGAVDRIGPKYALYGLGQFMADPLRMGAATRFALESSPQLKHRMRTFDRDIADFSRLRDVTKLRPDVQRYFFLLSGLVDMAASVPTWLGAYAKGLKERGGRHEDAVAYADSVMRTTQPAGATKDLPQVMRKPGIFKLFTFFYSYFSVLFNQFAEHYYGGQAAGHLRNLPQYAASFVALVVLPSLLADLVVGRGPKDDEDPWEWAAKTVGLFPFQTIPIVRDVAQSSARIAEGHYFGYEISPVARVFEATAGAIGGAPGAIEGLATGEGIRREWAKDVVDSVGYWGGLPSRQGWITLSAFYDWLNGEEVELSEFAIRRKRK